MSYAELNIDSKDRMFGYYPKVIQSILEFRAITEQDGQELNNLRNGLDDVISNAYLGTMLEDRIVQWEKALGITPIDGTTFDDRRETIIARIRGQGKLNTTLINNIVNVFTGGTANSWVEDGVLYVEITPPRNNKHFVIENVEQELKYRVPAHLDFQITRNYNSWGDLKNNFGTWGTVQTELGNWESVYMFIPYSYRMKR